MFTLGPNKRFLAEMIADRCNGMVRKLKGFNNIIYLMDDAAGEYGALTLWESKEDAEAAIQIVYPRVRRTLDDYVQVTPDIRLFEVYEPTI
ncbi:hypothetical protein ACFO8Q_23260 [Effusibacillus consociatus]|uniref:ABM domain-containing protein n=2 Tax=Effusibacillus consociatus TaxID=1117041 RepID=A0ABV9Q8M9_9BACL